MMAHTEGGSALDSGGPASVDNLIPYCGTGGRELPDFTDHCGLLSEVANGNQDRLET